MAEHTVLLIDDDRNVLHGLARVLRHQPYRLFTAASGEEAISVLKSQKVAAVVVDEQMPGIQGDELLAWIAAHFPGVVRIMLTGKPSLDVAIRAINEGRVFQFLTKPCNPAHLGVTIRKAIEQKELIERYERLEEENRRLETELDRRCAGIGVLRQVIAAEVEPSLQTLLGSCRSGEGKSACAMAATDRSLCERAAAALKEVDRLVDDLLR